MTTDLLWCLIFGFGIIAAMEVFYFRPRTLAQGDRQSAAAGKGCVLCGIQYASMSQPIPIRCSFPQYHLSSRHAGYDTKGQVFIFPGDPSILPPLPEHAPVPRMLLDSLGQGGRQNAAARQSIDIKRPPRWEDIHCGGRG